LSAKELNEGGKEVFSHYTYDYEGDKFTNE
jgi:hypothetical protein